jgi:hypothetical protein
MNFQRALDRQRICADLASLWFRSLLLVNGGAIVGLVTLGAPEAYTSQLVSFRFALYGFAVSAVLTLLSLLAGYLGQASAEQGEWQGAHNEADQLSTEGTLQPYVGKTLWSWWAAVVAAALSLAALAVGLRYAVLAVA